MADPSGVDPSPDPTAKKKSYQDPTLGKNTRIRTPGLFHGILLPDTGFRFLEQNYASVLPSLMEPTSGLSWKSAS